MNFKNKIKSISIDKIVYMRYGSYLVLKIIVKIIFYQTLHIIYNLIFYRTDKNTYTNPERRIKIGTGLLF